MGAMTMEDLIVFETAFLLTFYKAMFLVFGQFVLQPKMSLKLVGDI